MQLLYQEGERTTLINICNLKQINCAEMLNSTFARKQQIIERTDGYTDSKV